VGNDHGNGPAFQKVLNRCRHATNRTSRKDYAERHGIQNGLMMPKARCEPMWMLFTLPHHRQSRKIHAYGGSGRTVYVEMMVNFAECQA
jgi:hypothetical protein